MSTFRSAVSQQDFPLTEQVSGKTIRRLLLLFIQKEYPQFTQDQSLALSELNCFREKYMADYVTREIGELSALEKTVLTSLTARSTLADKIDNDEQQIFTLGQRIADRVASFGGSWPFICLFGLFLVLWIALNVLWLASKAFDPFPFILLNLILSCLAAIQAPVIMMSQNRQEEKDGCGVKCRKRITASKFYTNFVIQN